MSKEQEILNKYKALHIGGVSVSLPSVDDAVIIGLEIAEDCVRYMEDEEFKSLTSKNK